MGLALGYGLGLRNQLAFWGSKLLAPTFLYAKTYTDTSAEIKWTNNTPNSSVVIERSADNISFSEIATSGIEDSSFIDTGLLNKTRYYYRIKAVKSGKYSDLTESKTCYTVIGLNNYLAAVRNLDEGNNAIYDINFIGDSITEGQYLGTADQIKQNSFVGKIRSYFASKYGDVGYGVAPEFSFYDVKLWTYGGTWSELAGKGFANISKYTTELNSTATIQFTGTEVWLVGSSLNNMNASIDGGATITISPVAGNVALFFVASGLTNMQHTLVLTHKNTTGTYLSALYVKGGVRGFRCNNISKAGSISDVAQRTDSLAAAALLNPKLTVLSYITNEIRSGFSTANYTTWMQNIITSAKLQGDVILVASNVMTDKTKVQQDPMYNAMVALANANGLMVVDMYNKWNLQGGTLGYMYDTIHPNDAGHTDFKNEILKVLNAE